MWRELNKDTLQDLGKIGMFRHLCVIFKVPLKLPETHLFVCGLYHLEKIPLLLDLGADVNYIYPSNGMVYLQYVDTHQ